MTSRYKTVAACIDCGDEFRKGPHQVRCKPCGTKHKTEYKRRKAREWHCANKDRAKAQARRTYARHSGRAKNNAAQWVSRNRERRREIAREWARKDRISNPEKYKERRRLRRLNPMHRLNDSMSALMRFSLKRGKSGNAWSSLVDYDIELLRTHLERQFSKGMTWENYGAWHIDHIIPLSSFSFENAEDDEFKACWALENLRPLWASENIAKNNKRLTLL